MATNRKNPKTPNGRWLLSERQVLDRIPIGGTQLRELMRCNPGFPKPVKLRDNGRYQFWDADEIDRYIEDRLATREKGAA